MPDTAILLERPAAPASVSLLRKPALLGFLVRKVIASGRTTDRAHMVEACKAELDWSIADYVRITKSGANHSYRDGDHPADIHRMPHEWAAAKVLNCWGHLHPTEDGIRGCIMMLRVQIKTAETVPQWVERAERTREYLRLVLADRRKQVKAFNAAVAEYRALRSKLDISDVVA